MCDVNRPSSATSTRARVRIGVAALSNAPPPDTRPTTKRRRARASRRRSRGARRRARSPARTPAPTRAPAAAASCRCPRLRSTCSGRISPGTTRCRIRSCRSVPPSTRVRPPTTHRSCNAASPPAAGWGTKARAIRREQPQDPLVTPPRTADRAPGKPGDPLHFVAFDPFACRLGGDDRVAQRRVERFVRVEHQRVRRAHLGDRERAGRDEALPPPHDDPPSVGAAIATVSSLDSASMTRRAAPAGTLASARGNCRPRPS